MSRGIVMLVNEYPPLRVGGAERQAERLSRYLASREWPIWVITRFHVGLSREERQHGIQIIRPATFGPGKVKTVSFVLGTLFRLLRLRKEYEILHAHLAFGAAFAGVVVSRILGKRSIVKLGNSGEFGDILTSKRTLRGRFRLYVIRHWADIVIVLDNIMRQEAISAGFDPERVRLMSNGINVDALMSVNSNSKPEVLTCADDKLFVIFVGRLTDQKSLGTLLQAVAIAIKSCPSLYLVVLGDGPDRLNLERQAAELDIADRVIFEGYKENVEVYLQNTHIFVLPSVSEGISNALLEAMAFGLPCLATNVGGNIEVLDNGKSGVLLPPNDVEAWARALEDVANAEQLRLELGELARRRIAEHYDFRVIGKKYEDLYEGLLAGRKN